ncbi:MAG: phosphoheptose isomerase [Nitrospirae bacterium RBG_16_43_11]|nr:MAG: phosphoheptose isomerase [Nitrospirae bacterium RBG_16_43_11]
MKTEDRITGLFTDSIRVKELFVSQYGSMIREVSELIVSCFRNGNKLLLMGNGGSSSDASHIAGEFVGRFKNDRPPLPAIALNTDTVVLTCISNDFGYHQVFSRQVEALARAGDVVIAISTSGNSPNIIAAVESARKMGNTTIGLTGGSGGKLASLVDYVFIVPSTDTARIQEVHITLGHVICQVVEDAMFGEPS